VVSAALRRPGRTLESTLGRLAAEFRRFDFATLRMRDGVSLAAIRREPDEPGLYAVITDDADEMLTALREDADNFPPGPEARPGGNQPDDPDG
jgi:hypothetical protein